MEAWKLNAFLSNCPRKWSYLQSKWSLRSLLTNQLIRILTWQMLPSRYLHDKSLFIDNRNHRINNHFDITDDYLRSQALLTITKSMASSPGKMQRKGEKLMRCPAPDRHLISWCRPQSQSSWSPLRCGLIDSLLKILNMILQTPFHMPASLPTESNKDSCETDVPRDVCQCRFSLISYDRKCFPSLLVFGLFRSFDRASSYH